MQEAPKEKATQTFEGSEKGLFDGFKRYGHILILGLISLGALAAGFWVVDSPDRLAYKLNKLNSDTVAVVSSLETEEAPDRFQELFNNAVLVKNKSQQKIELAAHKFTLTLPQLPEGFNAEWRTVTLDNRVVLNSLKTPFSIEETTDNLGHEFFYYDAYLFEQMASQIEQQALSDSLMALAANTRQMGDFISQANQIKFDGAPTENMTHLHVRSQMMFYLNSLNESAFHLIDKSTKGEILKEKHPQMNQTGPVLQRFLSLKQQVVSNHALNQYPQIKQLIVEESQRLRQLAESIHIHWESTFHCSESGTNGCVKHAINMKIYPRQSLTQFKMTTYTELLALQAIPSQPVTELIAGAEIEATFP